jgi:hypothetical protein
MKLTDVVAAFAAVLIVNFIDAPAASAADVDELALELQNPALQGQQYFSSRKYSKLEAMVTRLVASKARSEDGRYQLYMLTAGFGEWFGDWDESTDKSFSAQFAEWHKQSPDSALEPVVEAIFMHALAWRARGTGYSSEVANEAWTLFRKRNEQALRLLMDNRKKSSTIPSWYELAIEIGDDAQMSGDELKSLFEEGVRRFPGFHSIYFSYGRQFSPRWGGSYESADAFIREAVSARTNPEGEELYARLYWLIDQRSGSPETFFSESLVSWPRMRNGFERLMKDFPGSKWNLANFAMFACRAHDAATYFKLRPTVDPGQARFTGSGAYSVEVCDARFMKEAGNRADEPSARLARGRQYIQTAPAAGTPALRQSLPMPSVPLLS